MPSEAFNKRYYTRPGAVGEEGQMKKQQELLSSGRVTGLNYFKDIYRTPTPEMIVDDSNQFVMQNCRTAVHMFTTIAKDSYELENYAETLAALHESIRHIPLVNNPADILDEAGLTADLLNALLYKLEATDENDLMERTQDYSYWFLGTCHHIFEYSRISHLVTNLERCENQINSITCAELPATDPDITPYRKISRFMTSLEMTATDGALVSYRMGHPTACELVQIFLILSPYDLSFEWLAQLLQYDRAYAQPWNEGDPLFLTKGILRRQINVLRDLDAITTGDARYYLNPDWRYFKPTEKIIERVVRMLIAMGTDLISSSNQSEAEQTIIEEFHRHVNAVPSCLREGSLKTEFESFCQRFGIRPRSTFLNDFPSVSIYASTDDTANTVAEILTRLGSEENFTEASQIANREGYLSIVENLFSGSVFSRDEKEVFHRLIQSAIDPYLYPTAEQYYLRHFNDWHLSTLVPIPSPKNMETKTLLTALQQARAPMWDCVSRHILEKLARSSLNNQRYPEAVWLYRRYFDYAKDGLIASTFSDYAQTCFILALVSCPDHEYEGRMRLATYLKSLPYITRELDAKGRPINGVSIVVSRKISYKAYLEAVYVNLCKVYMVLGEPISDCVRIRFYGLHNTLPCLHARGQLELSNGQIADAVKTLTLAIETWAKEKDVESQRLPPNPLVCMIRSCMEKVSSEQSSREPSPEHLARYRYYLTNELFGCISHLGFAYHRSKAYSRAHRLYQLAYNMRVAVNGSDNPHPDLAISLSNLACLHLERSQSDKHNPLRYDYVEQLCEMRLALQATATRTDPPYALHNRLTYAVILAYLKIEKDQQTSNRLRESGPLDELKKTWYELVSPELSDITTNDPIWCAHTDLYFDSARMLLSPVQKEECSVS